MRAEVVSEERNALGQLEVESLWLLSGAEVAQFRRAGLAEHGADRHQLAQVHHVLSASRGATRGQRIITNTQGALLHASGVFLPPDIAADDPRLWQYRESGGDLATWLRAEGAVAAFGYVPTSGERLTAEYLDPQWQREEFVRDPQVEIDKIIEWKGRNLDAQLTRGERINKRQRTTLNLQVGAGADDGYIVSNGSDFENATTFTSFGSGGSPVGTTSRFEFARFTSVALPNSATIDSAVLVYTGQNGEATAVELRSFGDDVDDAVAPTTNAEYVALAETTEFVQWDFSTTWTDNTEFATPDIKTVIQEIVDRAGWATGNALQTQMHNDHASINRRRSPYSYEGDTAKAVKLDIDHGPALGAFDNRLIYADGIQTV